MRPPSVLIEVADEGEGVPAGMEDAAFDRFRKLHADSPGVGLGLAIVRQVARGHGGDARFVRGAGRVVVTLPAPRAPAASASPTPALALPPDDPDAAMVALGSTASRRV